MFDSNFQAFLIARSQLARPSVFIPGVKYRPNSVDDVAAATTNGG